MRQQRLRGVNAPPAERRRVRAGPLRAELDGPDLRYLRVGGIEIVRRITMAVRDRNWGTPAPQLHDVELSEGERSVELRFEGRNLDPALGVDFSWHGELSGHEDGSITMTLDGAANADMDYNRIGWCVLHPAEHAGRRFRAWLEGVPREGRLPREIGPQFFVDGTAVPLIAAFDRLDVEVADDVWACFAFEGATFEMEDQRNWTDASFKTYSCPTQPTYPHPLRAGERIWQRVRVFVEGGVEAVDDTARRPVLRLLAPRGPLPTLGVCTASHGSALTARERTLLREAGFAHVRVDLDPAEPAWRDRLACGATDARSLDASLEVAVFAGEGLTEIGAALREVRIPVVRVLAFAHGEPTSSPQTIERVRAGLLPQLGEPAIVGGTNVFFTDINRFRPDLSGIDGVAWPITATVHADDDTSVVETAGMHGETIRSARAFSPAKSLHATPITFNARFNPHATAPIPDPAPAGLPAQVDRRQPSLLAGAWTVASLRHLAESGAASATYFETTGWRGLIETEQGSPAGFASWPGMVFPVYHVLADAGEWRGGEVLAVESTEPLAVEALAVRRDGTLHLLVGSLSPNRQRCTVEGLPSGSATLRVLDEESFAEACSKPEAFRGRAETIVLAGRLELDLRPYATVRLDVPA
jgi:hypothetical protein